MGRQRLKFRSATPEDLKVFESWFRTKGKTFPPYHCHGKFGFVVETTEPIACGFILPTISGLCLLDFMESNPRVSKITQGRAIIELIDQVIRIAKGMGYHYLIGLSVDGTEALIRHYKRLGASVMPSKFQIVSLEV